MGNKKLLDELVNCVTKELPASLGVLKKDLEQHVRHAISQGLQKFDLVSREEFDVQVEVLRRTREKLEQLEKVLKEFEEKEKTNNK